MVVKPSEGKPWEIATYITGYPWEYLLSLWVITYIMGNHGNIHGNIHYISLYNLHPEAEL